MNNLYLFVYSHWLEILIIWFCLGLYVAVCFGSFVRCGEE